MTGRLTPSKIRFCLKLVPVVKLLNSTMAQRNVAMISRTILCYENNAEAALVVIIARYRQPATSDAFQMLSATHTHTNGVVPCHQ